MPILKFKILLFAILFSGIGLTSAAAKDQTRPEAPNTDAKTEARLSDISELPRLRAGLPAGTIAWATPDQLHPTQPQTGWREVERKVQRFEDLLEDKGQRFSQKLFEFAYNSSISPVVIGPTPTSDSRYGSEAVLGYVTDRTHGSNAQSRMIKKIYGKKGLSEVLTDGEGRPLNFVLVRVMADRSDLTTPEFNSFMVTNRYCYLENWRRGKKGKTVIEKIDFADLPEKVYETTDNPYRGFIGELQHLGKVGRSETAFSQFVMARALVEHDVVEWDEIDLKAKAKAFEKAVKAGTKFFKSPEAAGLPGVAKPTLSPPLLCQDVLNQ